MALTVKGAVFDNDNTIAKIYPDPKSYWKDVFLEIVKECGGKVPPGREDEFMLSYYMARGFEEKLAEIGLKTTFEEFQAGKGRVDERLRLAYIRAGKSRLFDDAVEFIRYLEKTGIVYGVATFTSEPVVMAAFDQVPGLYRPSGFFGWDDSLRLGYEKPDPRIARTVLSQLGVEPKNAIMVGDRLTDVVLGNRAGMTTFLVKRRDEDGDALVDSLEREIEEIKKMGMVEEFCKIPDYQVSKLTEIIPVIEG
ncbi:MAG TPA: HAD hydrolase-like protein [bacterium]|nr:HAD hydrolase-like protein [bacterium]HPJ71402.1 HAD hydrolase-like protein [bacterium]HPQ66219.1 HAD hydrolase-like protein [bacterium]